MAVLPSYTTFRHFFAEKIVSTNTLTFTNGSPSTISNGGARGTGFITIDGIKAGMTAIPSGTAANDGRRLLIASLTESTLTLASGDDGFVTNEGPIAAELHVFWIANDELEQYPGPVANEAGQSNNLVRSGGFDGGVVVTPQLYVGSALTATVNAQAADATLHVDDYDWYLSQRTDDPTKQYLTIAQKEDVDTPTTTESYSGTVTVQHTALATTELGISGPWTIEQARALLRHCSLYCRRRSDGAIQWISLDRLTTNA